MNKIYLSLFAILAGNVVVAEGYVKSVGRTLNGNTNTTQDSWNSSNSWNNFKKSSKDTLDKIYWTDAKDLKKRLNKVSKNISNVSLDSKEKIKTKVTKLEDLVSKNQVADKRSKKAFKK